MADRVSVLIRADGGATIGAGHLIRCLALAETLRLRATVTFVTCQGQSPLVDHIRRAGITVIEIAAAHPDPGDAGTVARLVEQFGQEWVVIDGYHFDERYLERLRGARVMVIDDQARLERYAADVLLDQNVGALQQPYAVSTETQLLLGTRFTLLRPEFSGIEHADSGDRPRHVLVVMGAGDAANATGLVLEGLRIAHTRFDTTVLLGGANPHADRLEAEFGATPGWRIVRNTSDVARLMAAADMAIAGVGGVMRELACVGVPTLLVSATPAQHSVADGAHRYGAHRLIGDVSTLAPQDVAAAVESLAEDSEARRTMTRLGRVLIDGRGASRVAEAMLSKRDSNPWKIRPAAMSDAESIWEVATDPTVREQSFTADSFPYLSHEAWFADRLSQPTSRIWVAEQGGTVAGFVRYDAEDGAATINVAVAPPFRGRGAGHRLLTDTWPTACQQLGVDRVRGFVFETNRRSQTTFARAGFADVGRETIAGHPCVVFEIGAGVRVV